MKKVCRSVFDLRRIFQVFEQINWRADLLAGFTLAAVAIPEQLGNARLAGFPPHVGFLAFIAGSLAFSWLGSSRVVSVGADSTIAPIFAGALVLLAAPGSPHYVALAGLLALLVGATLISASLLRAGWISDLLSIPVLTGFLAGVSIHIALSQAPAFLGLPSVEGSVVDRVRAIWHGLPNYNAATAILAIVCLSVIVTLERLNPRLPGALIALIGGGWIVEHFDLASQGVALLGNISYAAPHFSLPNISATDVTHVFALAMIVSLVVMVQTAATSRAFPAKGIAPNIDQDFLGVGAGSMIAGVFGAFPVNASPPRTALVVESGGASKVCGVAAAAIVAMVLYFGDALVAKTPTAILAAVLMFVAGRIFRWRDMISIFQTTRIEFALVVVTMLMVTLLPLQTGVTLAILLSLLHSVWITTRTRMIEMERIPGTTVWWPKSFQIRGERLPNVLVVAFQAPLSFVNMDLFRRDLQSAVVAAAPGLKLVVLEASSIAEIDYSAAFTLSEEIRACHERGVDFAVARLESIRAQEAFERFGVLEALGRGRLFHSVEEAVRRLDLTDDRSPTRARSLESGAHEMFTSDGPDQIGVPRGSVPNLTFWERGFVRTLSSTPMKGRIIAGAALIVIAYEIGSRWIPWSAALKNTGLPQSHMFTPAIEPDPITEAPATPATGSERTVRPLVIEPISPPSVIPGQPATPARPTKARKNLKKTH
jgi:sulfate permease, SulP family